MNIFNLIQINIIRINEPKSQVVQQERVALLSELRKDLHEIPPRYVYQDYLRRKREMK